MLYFFSLSLVSLWREGSFLVLNCVLEWIQRGFVFLGGNCHLSLDKASLLQRLSPQFRSCQSLLLGSTSYGIEQITYAWTLLVLQVNCIFLIRGFLRGRRHTLLDDALRFTFLPVCSPTLILLTRDGSWLPGARHHLSDPAYSRFLDSRVSEVQTWFERVFVSISSLSHFVHKWRSSCLKTRHTLVHRTKQILAISERAFEIRMKSFTKENLFVFCLNLSARKQLFLAHRLRSQLFYLWSIFYLWKSS
jgi:hypothetical protein